MVKRKNNKNTSIIVKFYPSTDKEIFKLLRDLELTGVRVSNLINRWAIDVPFWKENFFAEKLMDSELVEKVYANAPVRNYRSNVELEEDVENEQ